MDNIHGYIRARKFHEYEYEYAKFSWIISMESPNPYIHTFNRDLELYDNYSLLRDIITKPDNSCYVPVKSSRQNVFPLRKELFQESRSLTSSGHKGNIFFDQASLHHSQVGYIRPLYVR